MLERNVQTRSMYRSVRYRVSRENSTRTADPSTCNFRIKRNSCLDTTMAHTNNLTNPKSLTITAQFKNLMKTDYLQSFNSMMEKGSNIKFEPKKRQVSFFEEPRVIIPNFQEAQKQVQQSQYPLLQPITQPLSHVQSLLANSQRQMQRQRNQMAQIKAALRITKQKTIKDLKGVKRFADQQFQNIRSILRKNQIQQQERKLKTKRQLAQINRGQHNNLQKFETLDNNSSSMQMCIFNSTPYNLKQKEQYGQTYV